MQCALDKGAEAVWIVKGRSGWGGPEEQDKRIETIVFPMMRLYGIEYRYEDESPKGLEIVWPGEGVSQSGAHSMAGVVRLKKPYPLKPTQQALDKVWDRFGGRKRLVLAERKCPYQERRNTGSGHYEWARERDAVLLPDDLSVSLDERLAYYDLAEMTLGVNAGNMAPAHYSTNRPYLITKQIIPEYKATRAEFMADRGMTKGFQFPWAGPHQRIDWVRGDNYQDTCAAYDEYLRLNGRS